jgi:hypothetical protein
MQFNLSPHPATQPAKPSFDVWVDIKHARLLSPMASMHLWFCVGAPISRFVVGGPAEPKRTEGLWQTTCFELFLPGADEGSYREWNFAPSGEWAAFDFTSYRTDVSNPDIESPYIDVSDNLGWWEVGVAISLDAPVEKIGLSAVLEEKDGTKSYWALAHSPGGKPDFHAPDCFAAKLA